MSVTSERECVPLQSEYFDHYNSNQCLNWEIGKPQSSIVRLANKDFFAGARVLDLGCGLGDNTRYIANKASQVVGADLVNKAIDMATKATDFSKYSNIIYTVYNILDEDTNQTNTIMGTESFDIVLDSCLFHGLSDADRLVYARQVRRLLKPNTGIYIQLSWCEKETQQRSKGPRKVRRVDLEELFSVDNGWQIQSIEDEILDTIPQILNGCAAAYLSIIRRL